MNRTVRLIAAIVAIQALLVGIYWLVERERSAVDVPGPTLGTSPPHEVDGRLPPLTLRGPDGGQFEVGTRDRPTLVHFWATWCPPCRDELPGLLALPKTHRVEVFAIALDDDWADIDRFLDDAHGPHVFLGDAEQVERVLGVRSLPVTLLVKPGARLHLRFDGARDWTDRQFVDRWLGGAGRDRD